MNEDERAHAKTLITRLLQEGEQKAIEGSYAPALVPIRKAKGLDRTNVYILALERQVEQLDELSGTGELSDEQRTDILDSLPVLLENALQNADPLRGPGMPHGDRAGTPEQDNEKRAATQWLKNQYFQRAHAYVKSGEYDLALTEVQRVIALDRQDRFAGEFELKIMQMIELRRRQPLVKQAGQGSGEPSSSGAALSGGPQSGPEAGTAPGPAEGQRRNKRPVMIVAILVTVLCVALAIYFFGTRNQSGKQYLPAVTEPAPEADEDRYAPIPPPAVTDSSRLADTTRSSLPPDTIRTP